MLRSRESRGSFGMRYSVYILSSLSGCLYVGITTDLRRRLREHKRRRRGFTSKYRVDRLVYHETALGRWMALSRERQIKAWRREKRVALIELHNPAWRDLTSELSPATGASPHARAVPQ